MRKSSSSALFGHFRLCSAILVREEVPFDNAMTSQIQKIYALLAPPRRPYSPLEQNGHLDIAILGKEALIAKLSILNPRLVMDQRLDYDRICQPR